MNTDSLSCLGSVAVIGRKLPPADAAGYLKDRHGIHRSVGTLANLRVAGGGPLFFKEGNARGSRILYPVDALDAWAAHILGGLRSSTSDTGTDKAAA